METRPAGERRGAKAWLWVAATSGATAFQVHRSRGAKALKSLLGEGPGEHQVIVSDRFPTYARAPNRQLCWAHRRRDFMAMIDRAAGGDVIGRRLLDQSRWIYTWWARLGCGSLSRSTLQSYVAGLRRSVGYLLQEGVACPCQWTAKICRRSWRSSRTSGRSRWWGGWPRTTTRRSER